MNHTGFFTAIKERTLSGVYLLEGSEEYIKQQALARLCAKLLPQGLEQMNLAELDNPDADALIAAAETLPFMGEKRVVVVRECDLLTAGRKQENEGKAEVLLHYLGHVSPSTCLVFTVKGKADGRKKLYAYLKKINAIVDFSPMSDLESQDWVCRSMKALGKKMDRDTAALLVFTVGRDAALLRQEMDKLANYAGDREEITSRDIEAICTKSLECTVFQMVDAQAEGRREEAFRLLSDMEHSGEDRMGILAMLLRQYRILYHARRLGEERVSQQNQAALLGVPPFAVTRAQLQARRYSQETLGAAYDALLQMEYNIKSGRLPQEGCAQTALLTLEGILKAT
ncbi:MAG: DNA polymerase III subunit delta [Clostridiales bacterium]|nr:DNA polymerase III subunit delta [Clostridiales bacterium]